VKYVAAVLQHILYNNRPDISEYSAGDESSHFGHLFRKEKFGSYSEGHQNSCWEAGEYCGGCHPDDILLLLPTNLECAFPSQRNFVQTQTALDFLLYYISAQHECINMIS
jgi:hypothetical protein